MKRTGKEAEMNVELLLANYSEQNGSKEMNVK